MFKKFFALFTILASLLIAVVVAPAMGQEDYTDNKCYTEWDWCNDGTPEEQAYWWQAGWLDSAYEDGASPMDAETFDAVMRDDDDDEVDEDSRKKKKHNRGLCSVIGEAKDGSKLYGSDYVQKGITDRAKCEAKSKVLRENQKDQGDDCDVTAPTKDKTEGKQLTKEEHKQTELSKEKAIAQKQQCEHQNKLEVAKNHKKPNQ